jgi:hypothetical protein
MKQYTNESQTAKLIELGFEKPKSIVGHDGYWGYDYAYSIGELLSFLPEEIKSEEDDFVASLQITSGWELYYTTYSDIFYYVNNNELIDGLFDLCVKLKEKGVI